jgi:Neprosin
MQNVSLKRIGSSAFVLTSLYAFLHVGCSSPSPGEGPKGAGVDAPLVGVSAVDVDPAAEAARIQAFVDSRYKASDVRSSFRTKFGEDIDCVDFFAEPGVKAMAARGEPITELPVPPPIPEAFLKQHRSSHVTRPEDGVSFRGQLDDDGRPEKCPVGTVAEVRITAEQIQREGGLDAFRDHRYPRKHGRPAPPTNGQCSGPADYPTYGHVVGTVVNDIPPLSQVQDTMAIYDPADGPNVYNHSLAQLWLTGGQNSAISTCGGGPAVACTSNCIRSIELGWRVANTFSDRLPHLFTFSTIDGYSSTGCYDTNSSSCEFYAPNGTCKCPAFIPDPSLASGYTFGQTLPFNPTGEAPAELATMVFQDGSNNYWLIVQADGEDPGIVGYYAASDFTIPMDTFQIGGEVDNNAASCASTDPFLDTGIFMGSGAPPVAGYEVAAYHHDYNAWEGDSSEVTSASICSTRPEYSFSLVGGDPAWQNYFFYGGDSYGPLNCIGTGACSFPFVYDAATCGCVSRFIRF